MIWDEPWTQIALQPGGTTIPPPKTPLEAGQRFEVVTASKLDLGLWADFVGTRWTREELAQRLEGAVMPCLWYRDQLVATCVLRRSQGVWILETLRAKKGNGRALLRATVPWLYAAAAGPFTMMYVWELSLPGLVSAWARGWLTSATRLQYGWSWTEEGAPCGFCPDQRWEPLGPRLTLPTLFQDTSGSAVVSDSGLGDGWGYISTVRGAPNWSAIAKKGDWRHLWIRSEAGPAGFRWSGEFIVVGALNHRGGPLPSEWITAEIASD
jgi:hypothetical protein